MIKIIADTTQWKAFKFIDVSPVKLPDETANLFGVRPFLPFQPQSDTHSRDYDSRATFQAYAPAPQISSSARQTASSTSFPRGSALRDRSRRMSMVPSRI